MLTALKKMFLGARKRPEVLPARNEACWCGSGQKYKRCCLDKDRLEFQARGPRGPGAGGGSSLGF